MYVQVHVYVYNVKKVVIHYQNFRLVHPTLPQTPTPSPMNDVRRGKNPQQQKQKVQHT